MKKVLSLVLSFIMLFNVVSAVNVVAFASNGENSYHYQRLNQRPPKVKIKNAVEQRNGDVIVKWYSVKNTNGYQLYFAKDHAFNRNIVKLTVGTGKSSLNISRRLLKSKPNYVKIRAFKISKGKRIYGSWSCIKSIR